MGGIKSVEKKKQFKRVTEGLRSAVWAPYKFVGCALDGFTNKAYLVLLGQTFLPLKAMLLIILSILFVGHFWGLLLLHFPRFWVGGLCC